MMRATQSHSLVQKDFAPGCVAMLTEVAVLSSAEAKPISVRPPEQSFDTHAPARGIRKHSADFGLLGAVKKLIGVAAPVGEEQLVAGVQLPDRLQKPEEVGRAVDQVLDPVPDRPRKSVRMPAVDGGRIVASLETGEEPAGAVIVRHRPRRTHFWYLTCACGEHLSSRSRSVVLDS